MKALTIGKSLAVAAMIGASWLAIDAGQKAQALTFTESGDAGQTLGTAQAVGDNVNVIRGSINPNSDADLFSFFWGGGNFNARTSSSFDPILSLFNSAGTLLTQNDDSFGTLQSFISQTGLTQGQYLLGIASFPNFAGNGPTFGNRPGGSGGAYSIALNQPTATAVPTPALLPGLIGMGVAALRKRKAEAVEETSNA